MALLWLRGLAPSEIDAAPPEIVDEVLQVLEQQAHADAEQAERAELRRQLGG